MNRRELYLARKKPRTSIRVDQRLFRWDGEAGYVGLNSLGKRLFELGEEFVVNWKDGEAEYLILDHFEDEGITWGKGIMPWAR